jgi:hypothetical protein
MAHLQRSLTPRFGLESTPLSFLIRLGRREIFVCRDFRNRYYHVNRIVECSVGVQRGHLEILLLRRWLIILSKGR